MINLARKINQSEAVGPQVYRILRDTIIRGGLVSGSRISEAEISKTLDTSRQPVREAFIKLSEEGLVEVRPQRGTLVTRISPSAVRDVQFVREAIEAEVVRLLAASPDPAAVLALRGVIARQKEVTMDRAEKFIDLDDEFHRTLAEAAGKAFAWKIIENLRVQMDRVRFMSILQRPYEMLIRQHEAIVDAIERGEAPAADAAVREHLRAILGDLPEIVRAHAGLFEDADAG